MADDGVECSRCGETFATQDDLIVHSIESHVDESPVAPTTEPDGEPGAPAEATATDGATTDTATTDEPVLDDQTLAQLQRVIDSQTPGEAPLQALYGQRFIVVAVAAILAIALVLTGVHAVGLVPTEVFTFALGTLFGLTLAYFHAFVQSAVQ